MVGGETERRAEAGGWGGEGVAMDAEFEVSGEWMEGRLGAGLPSVRAETHSHGAHVEGSECVGPERPKLRALTHLWRHLEPRALVPHLRAHPDHPTESWNRVIQG